MCHCSHKLSVPLVFYWSFLINFFSINWWSPVYIIKGAFFLAVLDLLLVVAVARFSCLGASGILILRPGIESASPLLEGGFLITTKHTYSVLRDGIRRPCGEYFKSASQELEQTRKPVLTTQHPRRQSRGHWWAFNRQRGPWRASVGGNILTSSSLKAWLIYSISLSLCIL